MRGNSTSNIHSRRKRLIDAVEVYLDGPVSDATKNLDRVIAAFALVEREKRLDDWLKSDAPVGGDV